MMKLWVKFLLTFILVLFILFAAIVVIGCKEIGEQWGKYFRGNGRDGF